MQKSFATPLWDLANKLRGSVELSEYKHVVPSLIFQKFVSVKFEILLQELIDEGKGDYAAGEFERSVLPIDAAEMKTTANVILRRTKEKAPDQYSALLQSIALTDGPAEEIQTVVEAQ